MYLDKTLGVLIIGLMLNGILYGVGTVQVYTFHHKYYHDRLFIRSLIFVLWLLNTFSMTLYLHTVYDYAVNNFMNPEVFLSPPWSIMVYWLVAILSDCSVTGVYAYRVWKLPATFKHTVPVIVTMTMLSLAAGVAFFALALGHPYEYFETKLAWLYYITIGSELTADLVITTAMCRAFYQMRTGIRRTDTLLNVLMLYTVNTCALTSALRAGSIFAFAFGQKTFVFVLLSTLLPRSIFSSLLALLNSRQVKREEDTAGFVSIHVSKLRRKHPKSTVNACVSDTAIMDTTTEEIIDPSVVSQNDVTV